LEGAFCLLGAGPSGFHRFLLDLHSPQHAMRQINPYMAAAHRSGEPEVNAAKQAKALDRRDDAMSKLTKYRLYAGDSPVGMILECFPMEAHAWNRNVRAFYAWQRTLGRVALPLLEYREELDQTETKMMRVFFRLNGQEKHRDFCASSKAEAKREFNKIAAVSAVLMKIEPTPDTVMKRTPDDSAGEVADDLTEESKTP
jgi:hypothetical protein